MIKTGELEKDLDIEDQEILSPLPVDSVDDDSTSKKRKEIERDDSWPEHKKVAFEQKGKNDNTFYMTFTEGEKKTGIWSKKEKEHYINELKTLKGLPSHWGLFSQKIPGRNGQQCYIFYRNLVRHGEIEVTKEGLKFHI